MSKEITLSIPDEVYEHIERVAAVKQSDVVTILNEHIVQSFDLYPIHPQRTKMEREIAAYETMHKTLVEQYKGEFVAIHNGKLVDHDSDAVALHKRIARRYPNQVVLSRKVQNQAQPVLMMRSPRLERG